MISLANSNRIAYFCGSNQIKGKKTCSTDRYYASKRVPHPVPTIHNQKIQKMGTVKNAELSMLSVRRLLERNHLAYTIEENAILFNRRFNRRSGQRSYYYIRFTEGRKIGRQKIAFGYVDYNVYDDDFVMDTCFRVSDCTDMAFFAFHFRDLFPDFYPTDEYNDWNG